MKRKQDFPPAAATFMTHDKLQAGNFSIQLRLRLQPPTKSFQNKPIWN